MRGILAAIGLMMVCSCYALKVISLEMSSDADNQLQIMDDIRLPVKSKTQAGIIKSHPIALVNFSSPIFAIGDDAISRDWLVKHAAEMKAMNALGFITNVETKAHLQQLEELAGFPLMPVNIDDLSEILQVSHYPFVFESGVVWQ
ncbi:MAG TPA: integrating conjugative element protein [Legionella sp.]|nr:integrating conjugative element protein [Legionella sp.]